MNIVAVVGAVLVAWLLPGSNAAADPVAEPGQRLQQARELASAGDTESAISILDQLRAAFPHDVDYAFARAQLFARQGRDAEALDELRDAMRLAPDYAEVRDFYDALLARQHPAPADAAQWSLLAGAGYQDLDSGLPSWNEQFFEISRQQQQATLRAGINRDQRYDQADVAVSIGGDRNFASGWLGGLNLSIASNADFRPELEYSANVGRALERGWVAGVRFRRREYETIAVSSASTTIEKYLGQYRAAYSLVASRLPGASTLFGHVASVNWYYSERASVGLTVSSGKEAEAIGPGQVLESDVRGISVNGRRQLNERFGLQWWFGLHDQGDFYRRTYLGLAVSIKL